MLSLQPLLQEDSKKLKCSENEGFLQIQGRILSQLAKYYWNLHF